MVVEGDVIIEVAIYYCSLYYKKTFMSSDLVLFAARDGGSVREDAGFFFFFYQCGSSSRFPSLFSVHCLLRFYLYTYS